LLLLVVVDVNSSSDVVSAILTAILLGFAAVWVVDYKTKSQITNQNEMKAKAKKQEPIAEEGSETVAKEDRPVPQFPESPPIEDDAAVPQAQYPEESSSKDRVAQDESTEIVEATLLEKEATDVALPPTLLEVEVESPVAQEEDKEGNEDHGDEDDEAPFVAADSKEVPTAGPSSPTTMPALFSMSPTTMGPPPGLSPSMLAPPGLDMVPPPPTQASECPPPGLGSMDYPPAFMHDMSLSKKAKSMSLVPSGSLGAEQTVEGVLAYVATNVNFFDAVAASAALSRLSKLARQLSSRRSIFDDEGFKSLIRLMTTFTAAD